MMYQPFDGFSLTPIAMGVGLASLIGAIGAAPAQAQYESFRLNPAEAPLSVTGSGQSGGWRWTEDCGHVDAANAPDHVVDVTAEFSELRATVAADADVTLYIQFPDGRAHCVDNANGSELPEYIGAWPAGTSYLWIGDWDRGLHPYQIMLSASDPNPAPVPPDAEATMPLAAPAAAEAAQAVPAPSDLNKQTSSGSRQVTLSSLAMTVFTETNAERTAAGRSPLTLSSPLTQAAQAHAEDLARRRTLSHTGADGSSVADRVTRRGYRYRRVGENVAFQGGYRDAVQVVDNWMNSSGHRANILQSDFTEIGIGYAASGDRHYFVQVFGRSR